MWKWRWFDYAGTVRRCSVCSHSSPCNSRHLTASTEIPAAFDLGLQRSMRFLTCVFQARVPNMSFWTTWRWDRKRTAGWMNASYYLSNFLSDKFSPLLLKQKSDPRYVREEVLDTFRQEYGFYPNQHGFCNSKPFLHRSYKYQIFPIP